MKGKIVYVLVGMLMLSSIVGALPFANAPIKSNEGKPTNKPIDKAYSHNVLGEFFTMTTCVPCKYVHQALYKVFYAHYHPFYYITYVYNKNNNSRDRKNELGVSASPTTMYDGGYTKNLGGDSIEGEMEKANSSIIKCGNRNVKDIDLSLNVEWLGAVNNHPLDGQTKVPIEQILNWTVSEFVVDAEVKNNEASQYNGHLHVQVTEVNSTWWKDKFGKWYTFEFKDYAINEDVTLSAGGTWSDSVNWDGCDHNDKDEVPRYFSHITQDNIMVIAAIFDKDNDKYVDETAGFLAGEGTDPKKFDVYFGDTNPPPQVIENGSAKTYPPHENLNWTTKYFWRVDVWNALGNVIKGDVWSFTTRGNTAPNPPEPLKPKNNATGVPIDTNLSWTCIDPENDDLKYDVYFGEWAPGEEPPIVAHNITDRTFDPSPYGQNLEFNRRYHWKIVAWEEYGETSTGGPWNFTTQQNVPPDPAHDPTPQDKANNVPGNAILSWNGSDPNSGDTLKYDVFFSINYPPIFIPPGNQTKTTFDPYGPNDMPLFEEFYWRIVTWDKEGLHTSSPIWSFKTGVNPPPSKPEIDGPDRGVPGVEYSFTFVSTDPDNNTIKYLIAWDDGTTTNTTLYKSGEVVTLNHTWGKEDKYVITATSEDLYGEKSAKSEHKINIPRTRANNLNLLSWLLERFSYVFPILRYLLGVQ
jgi:hypothetical protein